MAADQPLKVRCAEALGWTHSKLPPLGHSPGPVAWRSPDGKIEGAYLPPYGDDTPEGWACTGPLVERFGLTIYHRGQTFEAGTPSTTCTEAATACAAVAEWVAQYGREAANGR